MAIQYVSGGRRIMPPTQSKALKANPKHNCDRSIGADEYVYSAAPNSQKRVPVSDSKVTIVYTRFWSKPRWTFVTEARNVFGDILSDATRATFEEAREVIEDDLRAQEIIT